MNVEVFKHLDLRPYQKRYAEFLTSLTTRNYCFCPISYFMWKIKVEDQNN